MNRWQPPNLIVAIWLVLVAVLTEGIPTARAAGESVDQKPNVTIGVGGHYRVGCWVGVRTPAELNVTSIETRDGDGVQVRYQRSSLDGVDSDWTYVIPGSEAAPLVLQNDSSDASGRMVLSTRFPTSGTPAQGPAMIPLTMPWVLTLGDPIGIDQIGVNRLLNRDASIAVTRPTMATAMPDSVLGLDGIDMIVINSDGRELLSMLSPVQQAAITQWVTGGGNVLLTLGERTEELLDAAPWLRDILPIESFETTTLDPSAIETFTSSQTPLQPFVATRLPKNVGDILIMGRDQRRISTPIVSRYTVGFGSILVIAADLESKQFASWPERTDLISRLTNATISLEERSKERINRSTAYNDLAGQTRAILDRFPIQRKFNFSVLSLALMVLIAAIGPLDYLLINRVLGKPLLGWISFPLMAIGLSVLLASQSTVAGSMGAEAAAHGTVRCNRIEIVDVDTVGGFGREFSVNYLYTHEASRFDVRVAPSDKLQSIAPEFVRSVTAPFGYPGESFGGIQISIEDARLPAYSVASAGQGIATDAAADARSIYDLPLAPRSSKGFFSQVVFEPKLGIDVQLERRPGSELLQGELVNPLPFDLLDGKLVYRNWVYLLPTRFRSGDRIASLEKLRQKNFRWLLSRQKALESSTETQAWDPTARNSVGRVAEMLMFHRATGGSQYTSLENEPLNHLDLSNTLAEDRCILFGSVDESLTTISLTDSEENFSPDGDSLTLIRIVLPVVTNNRR